MNTGQLTTRQLFFSHRVQEMIFMHENMSDAACMERCRTVLKDEQTKSLAETNQWSHVDKDAVHADWDVLYKELSTLIDTSNPGDKTIQDIVHRHYCIACRFFKPSREAYIGMALFYAENKAMNDYHNKYHPNLVSFLGTAIRIYSKTL